MKYTIALVSFILLSFRSQAGVIIIEGQYQNKNIYVQNAYTQSGVGYCAFAVYVNERLTNDEVNSTAFEIDLSQLQLKYGQNLIIKIEYKDGCTPPKVLNQDALRPIPTFEIVHMQMSDDGLLSWTSKNEEVALPYIIEQFRWNKWINVGEVASIGSRGEHNYTYKVSALHSGENKFRLKQIGYQVKYSPEIKIVSSSPHCIFSVSKNTREIDFTCGTRYEVYNFYGTIVKKGYGSRVDIANLQRGGYYVCFDNSIGELRKK